MRCGECAPVSDLEMRRRSSYTIFSYPAHASTLSCWQSTPYTRREDQNELQLSDAARRDAGINLRSAGSCLCHPGLRAFYTAFERVWQSEREHIAHTADAGSPHRTQGRRIRRRRGGVESESSVGDQAFGEIRGRDQLRSRL